MVDRETEGLGGPIQLDGVHEAELETGSRGKAVDMAVDKAEPEEAGQWTHYCTVQYDVPTADGPAWAINGHLPRYLRYTIIF